MSGTPPRRRRTAESRCGPAGPHRLRIAPFEPALRAIGRNSPHTGPPGAFVRAVRGNSALVRGDHTLDGFIFTFLGPCGGQSLSCPRLSGRHNGLLLVAPPDKFMMPTR